MLMRADPSPVDLVRNMFVPPVDGSPYSPEHERRVERLVNFVASGAYEDLSVHRIETEAEKDLLDPIAPFNASKLHKVAKGFADFVFFGETRVLPIPPRFEGDADAAENEHLRAQV